MREADVGDQYLRNSPAAMAAPVSHSGGLGVWIEGKWEGNGRGSRGLLIGQKMAMNDGFNRP